jgi:hypothetical protein
MKNTRDYYAILDIPTGASLPEIKASYRRLMVALRKHPDLGGDHQCAALINEAYEVLSNDERRKEYAQACLLREAEKARDSAQTAKRQIEGGTNTRKAAESAPATKSPPTRTTARHCPLCGVLSIQPLAGPETRCRSCSSPLALPPTVNQMEFAVGGRRLTLRISKSNSGTIYPPDRPWGLTVKMRDLSLTGMSFYSEIPLEAGQVLRFRDSTLDAVISIVSCRLRDETYSIHARLLTVAFQIKEGVFVSTTG